MATSDPHLWAYRAVLALMVLVLPPLGLMSWSQPTAFDPMAVRVLLSTVAAISLVGTVVSTWMRERARGLLFVCSTAIYVWFLYAASRNHLTMDDTIGLLPLACLHPLIVRTRTELVGAIAFGMGGMGFLYLAIPEPVFPVPILTVLVLSLTVSLGASNVSRERLAQSLERRVADRTADLTVSLARAEAEATERARAEREALRASRAKSVFLANMSHELRTPLNAVVGYTQLVSDELVDRPDLVADLARVEAAAGHLLGLIDGVLDLSRIEADELGLDLRPHRLVEVVHEAIEVVSALERSGRPLVVDVGEIVVTADRARLRQVLVNLLSNASRHTERGQIAVTGRCDGDRVRIEVSDTGSGIAPSVLPRIFERFVTGEPAAEQRHGGSGLGLAITAELVDRMGGRIEVRSAVGVGTTFTVTLAAAERAAATLGL